jgi:hypothetical protein
MTRKRSVRKRILLSMLGGVVIPLAAIAGMAISLKISEGRSESLFSIFFWLVGWPRILTAPITPKSDDTSSTAMNIRLVMLIAVPVLDFLAYTLLTYLLLWWRDTRKRVNT